MKVLRSKQPLRELQQGSVATIGKFDGIHQGHQALLRRLSEEGVRHRLPTVVILFEPQPEEYFQKKAASMRITSLREKVCLLKKAGIDYVYCLQFNQRIALMAAEQFAVHYIFSLLNARYLLLGNDFRFGYQRQGDIDLLITLGQQYNCSVEKQPDVVVEGERVSSTKVRHYLKNAQLNAVKPLLGREYSIVGRVVRGDGRAREWGIPTANVHLNRYKLPMYGVFFVWVKRSNGDTYPGIANAGIRPTIYGSRYQFEVHLLDVNIPLYGELLEVTLIERLRDEQKFPSLPALIDQIHADVTRARQFFY